MTRYTKWRAHVQVPLVHLLLAATLLIGGSRVHAADIVNHQFFGNFSVAYFVFPGESACIQYIVSISGNFNVSAQSGDRAQVGSRVGVAYIRDDICSDVSSVASGSAQFPGGSAVFTSPTTARINASFVITDSQTGAYIPVVINAVYTGVGDAFSEKIISHNTGPNLVFNARFIGSFRFAIPSGTITIGQTTYDLSKPGYFDILFGKANSGSIIISRQ